METPIIFVQYERDLPQKQIVVSGPACENEFLRFSREPIEVAVVNLAEMGEAKKATVDFSNCHMLSSSEMFGFDPHTTELPRIRCSQNYNSVILHKEDIHSSFIGSMIIPSSVNFSVAEFEVNLDNSLSDVLNDDLLSECTSVRTPEFFVCRLEGCLIGFLTVSARNLVRETKFRTTAMITSQIRPFKEDCEVQVLGFFETKDGTLRVQDRSELLLGRASMLASGSK